jgi:hypothetical protein
MGIRVYVAIRRDEMPLSYQRDVYFLSGLSGLVGIGLDGVAMLRREEDGYAHTCVRYGTLITSGSNGASQAS